MTNPMMNPQPNYSGVTIQIANPSVYAQENPRVGANGCPINRAMIPNPQCVNAPVVNPYYQGEGYNMIPMYTNQQQMDAMNTYGVGTQQYPMQQANQIPMSQPPAYPPQYYLNNYNYQNNGIEGKDEILKAFQDAKNPNQIPKEMSQIPIEQPLNMAAEEDTPKAENASLNDVNDANNYMLKPEEPQDLSKSKAVIDDLDARALAKAEEKKNTKDKKVVALTDEYIKSLENYLNNPNEEIRLMASKEILTRLDEDKDRYNDAALNALLNKMLQDPSKLIRVASLSAFSSQLASGNDYTVNLLHNIQQNPNADKEDVLQAADILLKMSSGTEVKHIPNPAVKESAEENKG